MKTHTVRRARIAAVALAPALALATPAIASAADPQEFNQTRTTTDRSGVQTQTSQSCVGDNGEVAYQRTTGKANANGKTETTTTSGAMADCADGNVDQSVNEASVDNADRNNNSAANPQFGNADSAPLIVINTPRS